ncbi:MAG: cell division protein FtsH [Deltaproteobacteria bacterium CG_4_8_14_3_um_filter_45_9]|nr:MAG: cell division protein FtsH [Deltaproteobacteria bacterium CG03_land_8_20_14_0_80_45_14]PIX23521.1 MAG: cell division protein FtsH [Deltaproteobacteria bacterium CG_4_8_14_3_um_filter_45_9]
MKKDQKPTSDLRDLLRIKRPSDRGGKTPILKKTRFTIWYFVIAFLIILLIQNYLMTRKAEDVIPYSEFKESLRADKIKDLTLTPESINGKRETEKGLWGFQTIRVEDPDLVKELEARHVKYTGKIDSKWLTNIVSWIIPLVFFFILWRILFSRIGPETSVMSFGKSRAKIYAEKEKKNTFADVAGIDEAKEELKEVVEFLKTPGKFQRLGGKIPKGVLLVGMPGTGKTLLARAVAGEANVPFFSISGSDFVEMFVGVGAARVRDLFAQAQNHAPCIIFIDELDALGKARGVNPMGRHDEQEQTLNQLLSEMDGFDPNTGVIIMAATNRPEILDPALLRPGRFDRHVVVDRPDIIGREEILKIHTRNIKLSPDVDLKIIASRTPGFVGADLANIMNEAALLAARKNKEAVEMADIEEAIDRVVAGLEKKRRLMSKKEKEIVAFHESGHAIVATLLPNADPVRRISIIPRGISALGYTLQLPTEDRYLMTKTELLDRLAVLLGGRVAEEIVFGEISTGAHNDLQRATDIATSMVKEFGMSEKLGYVTFEKEKQPLFLPSSLFPAREYSEDTAKQIDEEVKKIVDETYLRVKEILMGKKDKLEELARLLLEKEVVEEGDLKKILGLTPSNP